MTCLISLMPARTAENSIKSALVMRDFGEGCFAGARRAPEDHRGGVVALDLHTQGFAGAD
jgi:hypothetical protein